MGNVERGGQNLPVGGQGVKNAGDGSSEVAADILLDTCAAGMSPGAAAS
jgi:hypothetical protein